MAARDRRIFLPLDEAHTYWRMLESGQSRPNLYKICAALSTIDSALRAAEDETTNNWQHISLKAWSQIRNALFNWLVRSFAGYFVIYDATSGQPVEEGESWPRSGWLEFYPEAGKRRDDSYSAALEDLDEAVSNALRWSFADGRRQVAPADFPEPAATGDDLGVAASEKTEAAELMERLNAICQDEARRGKRRAHEKWWQLYWEANSCADRKARHEIERRMGQLQSVWGRPH